MITKTHLGTKYYVFGTSYQRSLMNLAVDSFDFLLPIGKTSWSDFGELMLAYSTHETTQEIVKIMTQKVIEINVAGRVEQYTLNPRQGYPYVCEASQKYPKDQVYDCYDRRGNRGGWTTLRGYKIDNRGIYCHEGILI